VVHNQYPQRCDNNPRTGANGSTTIEDCKYTCSGFSSCWGFSVDSGHCQMYVSSALSDLPNGYKCFPGPLAPQSADDLSWGTKPSTGSPSESGCLLKTAVQKLCKSERGKGLSTHAFYTTSDDSLSHCKARCEYTDECKCFAFSQAHSRTCWLRRSPCEKSDAGNAELTGGVCDYSGPTEEPTPAPTVPAKPLELKEESMVATIRVDNVDHSEVVGETTVKEGLQSVIAGLFARFAEINESYMEVDIKSGGTNGTIASVLITPSVGVSSFGVIDRLSERYTEFQNAVQAKVLTAPRIRDVASGAIIVSVSPPVFMTAYQREFMVSRKKQGEVTKLVRAKKEATAALKRLRWNNASAREVAVQGDILNKTIERTEAVTSMLDGMLSSAPVNASTRNETCDMLVVLAGGIGSAANGCYMERRVQNNRPLFEKAGGDAMIFFDSFWKLSLSRERFDTWVYSVAHTPDLEPPRGQWTTFGYTGGDAQPAPTVSAAIVGINSRIKGCNASTVTESNCSCTYAYDKHAKTEFCTAPSSTCSGAYIRLIMDRDYMVTEVYFAPRSNFQDRTSKIIITSNAGGLEEIELGQGGYAPFTEYTLKAQLQGSVVKIAAAGQQLASGPCSWGATEIRVSGYRTVVPLNPKDITGAWSVNYDKWPLDKHMPVMVTSRGTWATWSSTESQIITEQSMVDERCKRVTHVARFYLPGVGKSNLTWECGWYDAALDVIGTERFTIPIVDDGRNMAETRGRMLGMRSISEYNLTYETKCCEPGGDDFDEIEPQATGSPSETGYDVGNQATVQDCEDQCSAWEWCSAFWFGGPGTGSRACRLQRYGCSSLCEDASYLYKTKKISPVVSVEATNSVLDKLKSTYCASGEDDVIHLDVESTWTGKECEERCTRTPGCNAIGMICGKQCTLLRNCTLTLTSTCGSYIALRPANPNENASFSSVFAFNDPFDVASSGTCHYYVRGARGRGDLTNGCYKKLGVENGKPAYRQANGEAIIYFDGIWKLRGSAAATEWIFAVRGSRGAKPPTGPWSTYGYSEGDAEPPTLAADTDFSILVLGATGYSVSANGLYRPNGTLNGRSRYEQVDGQAVIYYSGVWKLGLWRDHKTWAFSNKSEDLEAPLGLWTPHRTLDEPATKPVTVAKAFSIHAIGTGWRVVSVKADCGFNPIAKTVRLCDRNLSSNCASAIGGQGWTEALWIFGGDYGTPWMKFTRTTERGGNEDFAKFLEGSADLNVSGASVPGFSSSNPFVARWGMLHAVDFSHGRYVTQQATQQPELVLPAGGDPQTGQVCIARSCRRCGDYPVLFMVRVPGLS